MSLWIKALLLGLTLVVSGLGSATWFLYDKLDLLSLQNQHYKVQNRALRNKIATAKKRLRHRNKKIIRTRLSRARRKLMSAPARMIPLVGTLAVAGFTAYELHELCEDMEAIHDFHLFDDEDETTSLEPNVCGMDADQFLAMAY